MLGHRQLCQKYALAYQNKLICKGKVGADQKCVLDEAEKKLDLFNLVVIRQRIDLEVRLCFLVPPGADNVLFLW